MSTMRIMMAAALAAVFAVSTAFAQQPTTQRVAGTLDKVEGNTLYIKAASGPVILKLADNALVVARIKASAAGIKAGDYVANVLDYRYTLEAGACSRYIISQAFR